MGGGEGREEGREEGKMGGGRKRKEQGRGREREQVLMKGRDGKERAWEKREGEGEGEMEGWEKRGRIERKGGGERIK